MSDSSFPDFINSEKFKQLQEEFEKAKRQYENECEDYWVSLSEENRLKAFYSVCKRIYEGDIKQKGSYRWVLYEVFGFDYDAYGVGMDCHYMDIHNSIRTAEEVEQSFRKILEESQLDASSVNWDKWRTLNFW